ncbi:hypothetical protein PRIPAC_95738 [Pristionchus pacificus]|uniref:Membrane transporter n=1 Tax=Pristionchus pacificus TaxID=54126 RepID=A0A454XQC6_PRIPA|nr:hypothetical protein PRIPAC_95738 [Pristionchus pacificus]|eukprot:PDM60027.1 membrane transporter [Pristionchus pacificus]
MSTEEGDGVPPSPRAPDDVTNVIPVRPNRNVGVRTAEGEEEDDIFMRVGERDIGLGQKLSYGFGHFYNDLCASMWFTYLMIFLEKVINLQAAQAGFLMLIGQVVDAVSTPLIGIASDSSVLPKFITRIGRRVSWHLIGTIFVTLSFPFIFNTCLVCDETTNQWMHVVWYIPFISLFQFGWASVQISHLALIPDLTHVDSSRRTMNSLRYGGTVLANLAVFGLLLYLLGNCSSSDIIGAHDLNHFRLAGFIVVGVGLLSCLPFYVGTREPTAPEPSYSRLNSTASHASQLSRMHWTSWFGHIQFYQIALLYMLSRLYMNISQVYMPFYLTIVQGYTKTFVATIPMISFISSFFISTILSIPMFNKRLNKKVLYVFALALGTANCVWMNFELQGWKIYAVAAILGIAQSILLVTSLDITADLINKNTESGAFVYGAMSLVDKLANGIAYQFIELLNPNCGESSESCSSFYRAIMVYVPAVCLIASFLVLLSLIPAEIGARGRRMRPEDVLALIQEESERQEREEEDGRQDALRT